MAKRFIDTDIWSKSFRKASASLKILYFYLEIKADPAGVYEIDEAYLSIDLGFKVTMTDFETLAEKLPEDVQILPGEKILLLKFIDRNCGKLKADYNPHKPVFRALGKHNLRYYNSQFQGLGKTSASLVEEDVEEEVNIIKDSARKEPEIPELIEHLRIANGGSIDGTIYDNEVQCLELIKKVKKDFPGDPEENIRILIDQGMKGWHGKNMTNFKYILTNLNKIRKEAKNGTDSEMDRYRQEVADEFRKVTR